MPLLLLDLADVGDARKHPHDLLPYPARPASIFSSPPRGRYLADDFAVFLVPCGGVPGWPKWASHRRATVLPM